MENDEKKKKVIDELKRRKEIVERHIDFLNNHPKDFYSTECEYYKKSPILRSYRDVFGSSFANINAYIGKVIDNINSNYYPEEYYEIINVRDW